MKASEVLRKAKALIGTPDRWCKGQAFLHRQSCVVGAITLACAPNAARLSEPICDFFRNSVVAVDQSIGEWNDAPERTHSEVMEAFDRAIALAEAEENPQPTTEQVVSAFLAQQLEAVKKGEVIEYAEAK